VDVQVKGSPDLSVTERGPGAPAGGTWLDDIEVERLVQARTAARQAKNFAESDRIRDQLAGSGVIVEDKPGGKSTWRRA
jgi:cysteinyl-tRNA synthetase